MRTLLCCIGRNENQYIREYVEYYKNIGFTNICLFDNNYDGEEHFEEVIGDYIDDGFVILKDYRNRKICQLQAYNECYATYGNDYDWIAFFDCDEFLTLVNAKNVDEYFGSSKFDGFNCIKINWMCFGDNDKLHYEEGSVIERFPNPIPFDKHVTYNIPENYHIKSVIRGGLGLQQIYLSQPHSTCVAKACNSVGVPCGKDSSPFEVYNFSEAYLRHYSTKTIEEYCKKMLRGFPDHKVDDEKIKKYTETRFFRYNEPTQEKINIVKEILGLNMSYLLPYKPFDGEKRKDVQLFMLCYEKKDYDFIDNSIMTPIQCGAALNPHDVCKLKDNTGDNISDKNYFYVENTGVYWIWKNIKDAKYKGNCQYRRRFQGIDENTDFDKIFENYDVICAKPYNYPKNYDYIPARTVRGGYRFSHCAEDLESLRKVVGELYPEYRRWWNKYIEHGEDLYYSSGYIMKAEKYDEYCEFLFNCLDGWLKANNINSNEDLLKHVKQNTIDGKYIRYKMEGVDVTNLNSRVYDWQKLIGGFAGERLWTLWLQVNTKPNRRYLVDFDLIEGTRI